MIILADVSEQVVPLLKQILGHLHQQDLKMADFATDLQDYSDTLGSIASSLTAVLQRLQSGNVSPDQLTRFEQGIAVLHDVKDKLAAAAADQPTPAPSPDQPTPAPSPDQPAPPTPATPGA